MNQFDTSDTPSQPQLPPQIELIKSETLSNYLSSEAPFSTTPTPVEFDLKKSLLQSTLLLVDDEQSNLALLEDMLTEAGYEHIHLCSNPYDVLSLYRGVQPDLIVLDLMMPGLDGIAIMQQLKSEEQGYLEVPILVLTADISPNTKRRALTLGAKDFLNKPFDAVEFLLRINNLLETHFLYRNLQNQNANLEASVLARTEELQQATERIALYAQEVEQAHFEMLNRLAIAAEYRDDDTGRHTQRVGDVAALLAQGLGFPEEQVRWIHQAARLHDVGKIGISDTILLKPGKLTPEEFATMKTHTTIGAAIFENGHSELVQIAYRIAHSHHERWDGNGYPQGLKGENIPIEARLLAVADVFDALTHDRPYKKAWSVEEALAEIEKQSGLQFDPQAVEVFLTLPHQELI